MSSQSQHASRLMANILNTATDSSIAMLELLMISFSVLMIRTVVHLFFRCGVIMDCCEISFCKV